MKNKKINYSKRKIINKLFQTKKKIKKKIKYFKEKK